MIEVTDMIADAANCEEFSASLAVTLAPMSDSTQRAILNFVSEHHPTFVRYYENPKPGTTVCAIHHHQKMVGSVLLESLPERAELSTDGALACLVIAKSLRGKGLGSRAISAAASALIGQGCGRVIAEWVASVELYERLGFKIWKRRMVSA